MTGKQAGVLAGGLAGVPVQPVGRRLSHMDEVEFKTALKNRGLTVREACSLLHLFADVVIDRRDVEKALRVNGRLSHRETAMWRLLFVIVDERKVRREQLAA